MPCEKCGGCCRNMVVRFDTKGMTDEEVRDEMAWREGHGPKGTIECRRTLIGYDMLINLPCRFLTPRNLCRYHGTDKKPRICQDARCPKGNDFKPDSIVPGLSMVEAT